MNYKPKNYLWPFFRGHHKWRIQMTLLASYETKNADISSTSLKRIVKNLPRFQTKYKLHKK